MRRNVRSELRAVLGDRAAALRAAPTVMESILWGSLSGSQLGLGFRRQVAIFGRYIVDLAAPSARLVVEIDGGYHARRVGADARRDRDLIRFGSRVHLDAGMVQHRLADAVALVRAALAGG